MKRIFFSLLICIFLSPIWLKADTFWQIDKQRFKETVSRYSAIDGINKAERWFKLIKNLNEASKKQDQTNQSLIINKVNQFFQSNISYMTDTNLYNTHDYWASVTETLGRGFGDCEDFAIAQYSTLRILGIPDEKLRLIYVKAQIGNSYLAKTQAHMVLGYYSSPDAEPLIIDSLIEKVLPASKRSDLTPVFSFNSAGLWAGNRERRAKSNPLDRLSRWRDVLSRLEQEGISWRNN